MVPVMGVNTYEFIRRKESHPTTALAITQVAGLHCSNVQTLCPLASAITATEVAGSGSIWIQLSLLSFVSGSITFFATATATATATVTVMVSFDFLCKRGFVSSRESCVAVCFESGWLVANIFCVVIPSCPRC